MDFGSQCIYECTVHPWGTPANRINISEYPSGHNFGPPMSDKYMNIRTILNEHYWHLPTMHFNTRGQTNTSRHNFLNMSANAIEQAAWCVLSILNVPEEVINSMRMKILDFANNMINNTHKNCVIFFMMVEIDVSIHYSSSYSAAEAFLEDNKRYKIVSISKDGLDCPICLEGIEVGASVIHIPCSHLMHDGCLLNWLLRKRTCPLCRSRIL